MLNYRPLQDYTFNNNLIKGSKRQLPLKTVIYKYLSYRQTALYVTLKMIYMCISVRIFLTDHLIWFFCNYLSKSKNKYCFKCQPCMVFIFTKFGCFCNCGHF